MVLFWYYEAIVASFACGDGWNSDKLLTVVVICEMRIMQHFSSEDRMTVNGFSKKHLDGKKTEKFPFVMISTTNVLGVKLSVFFFFFFFLVFFTVF